MPETTPKQPLTLVDRMRDLLVSEGKLTIVSQEDYETIQFQQEITGVADSSALTLEMANDALKDMQEKLIDVNKNFKDNPEKAQEILMRIVEQSIRQKQAELDILQYLDNNKQDLSKLNQDTGFLLQLDKYISSDATIFGENDHVRQTRLQKVIEMSKLKDKDLKKVKLLDPSRKDDGTMVSEIRKDVAAVKVEFTVDKEENKTGSGFDFVDKIVEDINEAEAKGEYNDYNSMQIDGVSIRKPKDMWGEIKVPATYTAYNNSPRVIEAEQFISDVIQEVRKIKAQNNEEKTTGLLSGKRINRRALHRTDGRLFMNVDIPEEEEAELSVYVALDFSGSTGGGLDKQIASVGIALIETFEALKIKHTIMGYTGPVTIIKRGVDPTHEKFLLASPDVRGTGGNNEFAVFKTCETLINSEDEKDVVIIVITDGDGCGEETGISQLRESAAVDKNIEIHSVGLSYDGGSYTLGRAQGIYGSDCAHVVKSRKELGTTVASIIERSVLKKGK